MNLDARNVEWLEESWIIEHRMLTLLHGDEWRGGGTSPVNPARTAYLRARECVVSSHEHRTSQHTEQTLRGTTVSCWSLGCLCNLHPDWKPLTQWNHGFAVLDLGGKDWRVENYRIVNREVV